MTLLTAREARKIYEESTQYVLLILDGLSKRINDAAREGTSLKIRPPGFNIYPFHKDLENMTDLSRYYQMNPAQQQIFKSLQEAGYTLKTVHEEIEVGGGLGHPGGEPRETSTERINTLVISW